MRLYIDDDSVDATLIRLLRRDGHDVQTPVDVGLAGRSDQVHLAQAIRDQRAIVTRNYGDFEESSRPGRQRREWASSGHFNRPIRQRSAEQYDTEGHRPSGPESGKCRCAARKRDLPAKPVAIIRLAACAAAEGIRPAGAPPIPPLLDRQWK